MKENKVKFSNIKVKIVPVVLFIIGAFLLGYYFASFGYIEFKNKNEKDFSLMYKVSEILDEEYLDTREDQSEEITEQDKMWGAISGMVASYKDPYTSFLPPEDSKDLEESVSGEFVGIGVEFETTGGLLTVVSPLPGTPASKAGLLPKDVIIEVDGESSVGKTSFWAVSKIRGEKGTEVTLTIARSGLTEPFEVVVKRDTIDIPTVKTYNKDGVFVIKLYSFTDKSPELFFNAIKEFRKSGDKNLIIDLRGNPGGHLFAAVYIAGLFLEKDATIVTEEFGNGDKNVLKSGKYHGNIETVDIINSDVKVGVLVDSGSASASEILAGALHDHKKAILLGQNTFGKGTVQTLKKLDDDTSLKYTIAKWILPNGSWISHKGIPVDVEVEISKDEILEWNKKSSFTDEIDPQLQRAIVQIKKFKDKKEVVEKIEEVIKKREEEEKNERKETIKKILNNE